jgi:hypothetical protein
LALIASGSCIDGIKSKHGIIQQILEMSPLKAAATLGQCGLIRDALERDTDPITLA